MKRLQAYLREGRVLTSTQVLHVTAREGKNLHPDTSPRPAAYYQKANHAESVTHCLIGATALPSPHDVE